MERYYSAQDIVRICKFSNRNSIGHIKTRGYLVLKYSVRSTEHHRKYRIVRKRVDVKPAVVYNDFGDKHGPRIFYDQKTLDAFLEATMPDREGWPTTKEVDILVNAKTKKYSAQLWRRGMIRGRSSIIGRETHIHPDDVKLLEIDKEYHLHKVSKTLGVTDHAVINWSNNAPIPFIAQSVGVRRRVVPPNILARLKKIKEKFGYVPSNALKHLYDDRTAFQLFLDDILLYNPNSPPTKKQVLRAKGIYHLEFGQANVLKVIDDSFAPKVKVSRIDGFGKSIDVLLVLSR